MKKTALALILVMMFTIVLPVLPVQADSGGYVVKLKETSGEAVSLMALSELQEISREAGLFRAEDLEQVRRLGDAVEYYEPDQKARLFELPNDLYADRQWCLEFLGAPAVWKKGFKAKDVRIGVIDSGVNSMHEDFEGTAFAKGANLLDGSRDVTDNLGHGTMVSGILAAMADNGLGVAGLCDQAVIVPLKCFDTGGETDGSYIVEAIYEAVDVFDCQVINMSLGMKVHMQSMREAVDYAAEKGVIIVSAVGNTGNSDLNYPAAYDNVIGTGSVNCYGEVSDFSQKNKSVFVTAPGEELVGLGHESADDYIISSGTSDAAPIVAAAAAMLKQLDPQANGEDFKRALSVSCTDAGLPGWDPEYGYGILNLEAFVKEITGMTYPDVDGHWAEDQVSFCLGRGLFNGVSQHSYDPEGKMNRAMFVTVLSRLSGEDMSGYENDFTDVPEDSWYAAACAWGAEAKIVMGDGSGGFMPMQEVTREQMAVFLYRFAQRAGLVAGVPGQESLEDYSDSSDISGYALEAMAWAVKEGFLRGRSQDLLVPGGSASRVEVAVIINRFAIKYDI